MYNITISGKMEIGHSLDENKDISVVIKRAGLRSISRKPQSVDGEDEDTTYKYQNLEEITIIQEEKLIVGKPKKGSQSQVLRKVLQNYYDQQLSGNYKEFEDFYKEEMSRIIAIYENKLV
jgi:hypothetical protein